MPSIDETWFLDKWIPSDLGVAHEIIEELMQAMEKSGWPGGDMFHVQMALEEAIVNAIEHGNQRIVDKKVRVEFEVSSLQARMRITDEGLGFDHRNLADPTSEERLDKPRGRGVLLIRELMSHSEYNEPGNQVTLIKNRSSDTPAEDD